MKLPFSTYVSTIWLCAISLILLIFVPICLPAQTITTVAGSSLKGDGRAATAANLNNPAGVVVDGNGNLYIADTQNNRIRKVSVAGIITTVAGVGSYGFGGDGGAATAANLANPAGVAVDGGGNLYIADTQNNRIRKVSTAGIITTVAGNGSPGFSGDGGAATVGSLNNPVGVVADSLGNLYIADSGNQRIRKVTPGGIITTLVGNGTAAFSGDGGAATAAGLNYPTGVAVDGNGAVYIADQQNHRIRKVSASGIITTLAGIGSPGYNGDGIPASTASLNEPTGLTVDRSGNLYIADQSNHRVRWVAPGGTITTFAGDGNGSYSGDGGAATAASLYHPDGVAVDGSGNLYIADALNYRLRKVSAAGIIATVAGNGTVSYGGDGGAATAASLSNPVGVAVDGASNIYIVDQQNQRIRKVSPSGTITTVAGNGVYGFSGDGGVATSASLSTPVGITVDSLGNIYIADTGSQRIRKITSSGTISTVAGNGTAGFGGDGGAATAASLNHPVGVAVDGKGTLYIADSQNNRVRRVSASGIISTVAGNGSTAYNGDGGAAVAAGLNYVAGVGVDRSGNLYIADQGNHRIRKVAPGGVITTVAGNGVAGFSGDGGAATSASVANPASVVSESNGNLYITDYSNNRIRRVSAQGIISTVAGSSTRGFGGDGGAATAASLANPFDVAVDGGGNLYIADSDNQRVRKVTAPPSIISVQSGNWSNAATWNCNCLPTAGDVVTIATGHTVTISQPVQARALNENGTLLFSTGGRISF